MKYSNIFILLFLLGMGCRPSSDLSPVQYMKWVNNEKNGLLVKEELNDLNFTLLFKPIDYLALQELNPSEKIDLTQFRSTSLAYEGLEYYTLRVNIKSKNTDLMKYELDGAANTEERINYFSFDMQNDLKLFSGQDTLPCILYHFEQSLAATPYLIFLLGFEAGKLNEGSRSIIYHDRIFGKDQVTITINKDVFATIPNLRL